MYKRQESALPVPEAVLNDRNGDYRLLGVTEENIYWLYRQAICVQKGEELETAYSFRPVNPIIEPAWQYYQLIGGVLYFAYYGEPRKIGSTISPPKTRTAVKTGLSATAR